MISRKMIIKNETGLHLKPAAVLCEEARKYSSLITFTCGTATANLKSVLSILADIKSSTSPSARAADGAAVSIPAAIARAAIRPMILRK